MTLSVGDRLPDATFLCPWREGHRADRVGRDLRRPHASSSSAFPAPSRRPATATTCPASSRTATRSWNKGVRRDRGARDQRCPRSEGLGGGERQQATASASSPTAMPTSSARPALRSIPRRAAWARARSRFAMIVEDGIVRWIAVEEVPGQVIVSAAARILEELCRPRRKSAGGLGSARCGALLRQERRHALAGELVGALVQVVAGMAAHPVPVDLVGARSARRAPARDRRS